MCHGLRQVLAGLPQPVAADGRLVLAVDVTHWLRPDGPTSPDRLFCPVYGRSGRSWDQFVPAADRWTWLIIAARTQLRLTRPLAADLRHPWEKPAEPGRLTPARVRRGFRNLRPHLACPARAPKPNRPGSGRPLGSKNRHPATRCDVGKTTRRPGTIAERDQARP